MQVNHRMLELPVDKRVHQARCDDVEVVTGLSEHLRAQGLLEHQQDIEAWCDENGAAFLSEVLENWDSVLEDLSLTETQSEGRQDPLIRGDAEDRRIRQFLGKSEKIPARLQHHDADSPKMFSTLTVGYLPCILESDSLVFSMPRVLTY